MKVVNGSDQNELLEHGQQKDVRKPPPKKKIGSRIAVFNRYTVSLIIGIAISSIYAFQSFYSSWIGPISNIIPSIIAGSALIFSYRCLQKYGYDFSRNFVRIFFLFTLGMGCWFVAELTWAFYYFTQNVNVPYPSVADIFYIAAYAPIAIGLAMYFRVFFISLSRRRLWISIAIIAAAITVVISLVIPTELASGSPLLTIATDLTYPVLDVILFSLTVLSLGIFIGGTVGNWWMVLVGAIMMDIFGDELFLYQVSNGTYYNGGFDDLLYVWAYLLFAFAFYVHHKDF